MKKIATLLLVATILVVASVFPPLKQTISADQTSLPACIELQNTELGKLNSDAPVDMTTFINAAVPYLTFEQGEDPVYVAEKQGYFHGITNGYMRNADALYPLLRMTGVEIPDNAALVQLAKLNGIIDWRSNIGQNNEMLNAATASTLIVNARNSWYGRMEAETSAERIDIKAYLIGPGVFNFSPDGKTLLFMDGNTPKAVNTADGSVSTVALPEPPDQEHANKDDDTNEYKAQDDEEITPVYDNAGVERAVLVETYKRHNWLVDKYILYREDVNAPWRHLIDFDTSLTRDYEITGFTPDNQRMYVKTNIYDNYTTLYEVDPKTMTRTLLYQNPNADVAVDFTTRAMGIQVSSLCHPQTGELLTILYLNDKAHVVALNKTIETIMQNIGQDLGENQFPLTISADYRYILLMHRDDRDSGSYRLYDTKQRTSRLISDSNVPVKNMAHTYPVSFKASDGKTIYAYLTVPLGKSPRNLPLLVSDHGGPQDRVSATPDAFGLLASNRGAAVLSVNFRFSVGYGNEYTDSASKDKLLPQRDIYEASQWAITQRIADPQHIGIMGHSYGGYSAYYQAATHPNTYKVAIPMMGIWDWSDLGLELTGGQPMPAEHLCAAPEPNTELASIMSPSSYVDNFKMPLLVIYSGKDEAVYPSQNVRAIKELTAAGHEPQVLYLPESGHSPSTLKAFDEMFSSIGEFLDHYFFSL
jgi:dipeptidyl aminopeptidase/acylaminoacyl peptidase